MLNQSQSQLSGLRRNQQFLYVGVFTLVVVIVWVAGSLFQSQKKTGISTQQQLMAKPLNPNINSLVIDRIEAKRSFSSEELAGFEIFKINLEEGNRKRATQPAPLLPTNTASASASKIASESAEIAPL